MNILVTGCFGFIGSNLVIKLLNQGHKVLGFDNLSRHSINPTDRIKTGSQQNWSNFTFYRCDITERGSDGHLQMMAILAACDKIDAVIHLAAVGSIPLSFQNPHKTMHNNVTGFANIMELVKIFEIPKLIFASSSSVYGASLENPRKEGREGRSLSPYALSKVMNEELAIMLAPIGCSFVGLRFFNVYGPGQSLYGYYSAVIPRFLTEEAPVVYGDGSASRDFTYVDDVCEAVIKSLAVKTSAILNVGTGFQTSINDLLDLIGKRDLAIYKDQRPGDVPKSFADTSKAKEILGFSATISIQQGLEITKQFYDSYLVNQSLSDVKVVSL